MKTELRLLVGLGITLAASGAGLFMVHHRAWLGPWPPLILILAAAAACLAWVWRKADPFVWNETTTPVTALDFILQLGLLFLAAALAFGEANFLLAGAKWPIYLLAVGVIDILAAYRFDSSTALSLGLSALATWRGAALVPTPALLAGFSLADFRWNATLLGLLFLLVGYLSRHWKRKPHFVAVWMRGGLFLLATGLLSGTFSPTGAAPWLVMLLGTGLVTSVSSFQRRETVDFMFCFLVVCTGAGRLIWLVLARYHLIALVLLVAVAATVLILALDRMRDAP